jgi:hypothetical protein
LWAKVKLRAAALTPDRFATIRRAVIPGREAAHVVASDFQDEDEDATTF